MRILKWFIWLTDRKVLDMCNSDCTYEEIENYVTGEACRDLMRINNFIRRYLL